MRHPGHVWTDESYPNISLEELKEEWMRHLRGRAKPISPKTINKYAYSMEHFIRFLADNDQPLVLASLTPANVDAWVSDQRRGMSEDGIASRLTVLKVFSHRFVFKQLEATTVDLLAKVDRITPPEKPVPILTDNEQDRLIECLNRHSYADVRNRALVAVLLATGLRLSELLGMTVSGLNTLTGEFSVVGKGNRWRPVRLSERSLKFVRAYLKIRPTSVYDSLWLTEEGEPLSFWGAQSIFRRLKRRSGVERVHAHALRHNFAKKALQNGVERGVLQDMLGHSTPAMTNRYLGDERKTQAAALMPVFAPF